MFLPLYGSSGPSLRKAEEDLLCNLSVLMGEEKSLIFSLFNFFSYCKDRSDDFRALQMLKLKLKIW